MDQNPLLRVKMRAEHTLWHVKRKRPKISSACRRLEIPDDTDTVESSSEDNLLKAKRTHIHPRDQGFWTQRPH